MICIAGPTSSGKTTFATKLCWEAEPKVLDAMSVGLVTNGRHAVGRKDGTTGRSGGIWKFFSAKATENRLFTKEAGERLPKFDICFHGAKC